VLEFRIFRVPEDRLSWVFRNQGPGYPAMAEGEKESSIKKKKTEGRYAFHIRTTCFSPGN